MFCHNTKHAVRLLHTAQESAALLISEKKDLSKPSTMPDIDFEARQLEDYRNSYYGRKGFEAFFKKYCRRFHVPDNIKKLCLVKKRDLQNNLGNFCGVFGYCRPSNVNIGRHLSFLGIKSNFFLGPYKQQVACYTNVMLLCKDEDLPPDILEARTEVLSKLTLNKNKIPKNLGHHSGTQDHNSADEVCDGVTQAWKDCHILKEASKLTDGAPAPSGIFNVSSDRAMDVDTDMTTEAPMDALGYTTLDTATNTGDRDVSADYWGRAFSMEGTNIGDRDASEDDLFGGSGMKGTNTRDRDASENDLFGGYSMKGTNTGDRDASEDDLFGGSGMKGTNTGDGDVSEDDFGASHIMEGIASSGARNYTTDEKEAMFDYVNFLENFMSEF